MLFYLANCNWINLKKNIFPLTFHQPNVLASAQRRKMKGYGDFKRIAAVIIPDDAAYKERCEKQTEKTVSENALNEMKGNFAINNSMGQWNAL